MFTLLSVIGSLIPKAHAALREGFAPNEAIQSMWDKICGVMLCQLSGQGDPPMVLALKVTQFITKMIGGAASLVLLYAAIKVILSQGKDEGISEGKKIRYRDGAHAIVAIVWDWICHP